METTVGLFDGSWSHREDARGTTLHREGGVVIPREGLILEAASSNIL